MTFLKSDQLKVKILIHIRDGKWYSYYEVQKALGINYNSLKKHMTLLESLGFVELHLISPDEASTGKGSYKAKITDAGKKWLKEISE